MSEHLPECTKSGCPACIEQGYSAAMDDGWGEPGHIQAALEAAAQRVETLGEQHPRWNAMGTHYDGCWKQHVECALTAAIATITDVP